MITPVVEKSAPASRRPCVAQACLVLVVTIILIVVSCVMTTRPDPVPKPEPIQPVDDSSSSCTEYSELKQGRFEIMFANIPERRIAEKQRELIELTKTAYNTASGVCDGMFERVLQGISLEGKEPAKSLSNSTSYVFTSWTALITCNGCPDDEPLFSDFQQRMLQENSTTASGSAFGEFPAHTDSNHHVQTFIDFLNDMLPGLFNVTDGEVVYFASIGMITHAPDQVFNIFEPEIETPNAPSLTELQSVTTEAPTVVTTIGPTGNPTIRLSTSPTTLEVESSQPSVSRTTASRPSAAMSVAPTASPTTLTPPSLAPTISPTKGFQPWCNITRFYLAEFWSHYPDGVMREVFDGDVLDWNYIDRAVNQLNIGVDTSIQNDDTVNVQLWVNGNYHYTETAFPYSYGGYDPDVNMFLNFRDLEMPQDSLTLTALPVCEGYAGELLHLLH